MNVAIAIALRRWPWVILAWVLLAAGLRIFAPSWDSIAHDGDLAFLPADRPSIRGAKLVEQAFAGNRARSQIVFILARREGELTPNDRDIAAAIASQYRQGIGHEGPLGPVVDVWTPQTDVVGRMLTADNHEAMLVVVQMDSDLMAVGNIAVLREAVGVIDRLRLNFPPGLLVEVTGSAAIGGDLQGATAESVRSTEVFTIVMVVAILLAVYRAPLLLLVPLITIGASVMVASGILALLTQLGDYAAIDWWHFTVFKSTRIFLVVLLYGAGTDYCLFLIARYRECLAEDQDSQTALSRALEGVSGALVGSAMTTIVGLGLMYFAEFRKFSNSGPAIAVALVVGLAASLTLAPALLAALGKSVLWPIRWTGGPAGLAPTRLHRGWERIADMVLTRPGAMLLACLIPLTPLAWIAIHSKVSYDLLEELSRDRPSVKGTRLLREYFPAGQSNPITILATSPTPRFEENDGERDIAILTKTLHELDGVSIVRSVAEPLGDPPGRVQPFTQEGLIRLAAKKHRLTKAHFVTQAPGLAGRVARFDVVTDVDPFSPAAIRTLRTIESTLENVQATPNSHWANIQFDMAGVTVGLRDLVEVTTDDRWRIEILVTLGVLAVLIVLLRKPGISILLILSVLWSYLVTLGATDLCFTWFYGANYVGLDWKVPIFLFVILVAVGEDYNIYLVTRVFEEQSIHGRREGLRRAMIRTGGIITSCGVIMAGTFFAMMFGSLRGMQELGFALSLGILLDTFLVRSIVAPAMLAIVDRWRKPEPAPPEISTSDGSTIATIDHQPE